VTIPSQSALTLEFEHGSRFVGRMRWMMAGFAMALPVLAFAAEPTDVSSLLEKIRDEYDVPALAAAAFDEGELVAIGADGSRSVKRSAEVTEDDQWILSSCAKSMTASGCDARGGWSHPLGIDHRRRVSGCQRVHG
jgi:CubicO group peptidase (beta-lactamase class C family)